VFALGTLFVSVYSICESALEIFYATGNLLIAADVMVQLLSEWLLLSRCIHRPVMRLAMQPLC